MMEVIESFGGLGSWILIGLLAGAVGKLLLPGKDAGGCVTTILVGMAGAVLGGAAATYLGFGGVSEWRDPRSLIIATLGAIFLLLVLRVLGFGGAKKDKKKK